MDKGTSGVNFATMRALFISDADNDDEDGGMLSLHDAVLNTPLAATICGETMELDD